MDEKEQKYLEACHAAHDPALLEQIGHVCQLWEDGEMTLRKSGPLLHQRSLHSIRQGRSTSIPKEAMPMQMYNHGCACVPYEQGDAIVNLLRD